MSGGRYLRVVGSTKLDGGPYRGDLVSTRDHGVVQDGLGDPTSSNNRLHCPLPSLLVFTVGGTHRSVGLTSEIYRGRERSKRTNY